MMAWNKKGEMDASLVFKRSAVDLHPYSQKFIK